MKKTTKYKLSNNAIVAIVTLFTLTVISTVILTVLSKEKNTVSHVPIPTVIINQTEDDNWITYKNAVFLDADTDKKYVKVKDVDTGELLQFDYSSGARITDKYDQLITVSQISKGQIVRIVYEKDSKQLQELRISNDIWENIGVTGLRINEEAKVITYLGKNFSYSKGVVLLSQGDEIPMEELLSTDYVTIRGYEENIYSIVVTKGHGFLELIDADQFIGGNIYVGTVLMQQITENMVLTVSEGEYEITVENKGLHGTKYVTIKREKTTQCSLDEFQPTIELVSQVTFQIEPQLSILYIDGKETNYILPVELVYGSYEIEVSMGGYTTYKGTILIEEPTQIISILLRENESSGTSDYESEKPDSSYSEENDTNNSTQSPSQDNSSNTEGEEPNKENYGGKDTITIEWVSGAQVFFDGDYVGTITNGVLVTDKKIGTFDVDLFLEPDETVTYEVTIEDDGEGVVLSFPIP